MSTATASALTAAEITDARLDVIARARETLERARSECKSWHGDVLSIYYVTGPMTELVRVLHGVDTARTEGDKDETVRLCEYWTGRVVAVTKAWMGHEAAVYVASGDEGTEEAA